jgi:protocatechuate 3,4-dioxygenase, alpha subunit
MTALTPSQTIGPFFYPGLEWAIRASGRELGEDAVLVRGRVLDADAKPVADALLEIWQPGFESNSHALAGFQRIATDDEGRFGFRMPPPSTGGGYANVTLFARGLLNGLFTRVYLCPAGKSPLALPPGIPSERVATLIAKPSPADAHRLQWDIRLCGEAETVFFDFL